MKNQNTTTAEVNCYNTFVDSILSLPPNTRSKLLNGGAHFSLDNNPYLWLWQKYCSETKSGWCYLHILFDKYKLTQPIPFTS